MSNLIITTDSIVSLLVHHSQTKAFISFFLVLHGNPIGRVNEPSTDNCPLQTISLPIVVHHQYNKGQFMEEREYKTGNKLAHSEHSLAHSPKRTLSTSTPETKPLLMRTISGFRERRAF